MDLEGRRDQIVTPTKGQRAGKENQTGAGSVNIGYLAGEDTTQGPNVIIGNEAAKNATTMNSCVFIGPLVGDRRRK